MSRAFAAEISLLWGSSFSIFCDQVLETFLWLLPFERFLIMFVIHFFRIRFYLFLIVLSKKRVSINYFVDFLTQIFSMALFLIFDFDTVDFSLVYFFIVFMFVPVWDASRIDHFLRIYSLFHYRVILLLILTFLITLLIANSSFCLGSYWKTIFIVMLRPSAVKSLIEGVICQCVTTLLHTIAESHRSERDLSWSLALKLILCDIIDVVVRGCSLIAHLLAHN